MPDPATQGAAEHIIDRAAREIHNAMTKELGLTPLTPLTPTPTDYAAARALGRRGYLLPAELFTDRSEWAIRRAGLTIPYPSERAARQAAQSSPGFATVLRRDAGPWCDAPPEETDRA